MRTLSVAAIRRERRRRGEEGFTLIELLVVVTIIGILAAIVSVSVGGFTGQATVKARKTSLTAVQAAVDTYLADNVAGDGTVLAPTGDQAVSLDAAAEITLWFNTDGKTSAALFTVGAGKTFKSVVMASLTSIKTTTIGNVVTTRGPYLRSGANPINCVFASTSATAYAPTDTADTQYKVIACKDATGN